MLSEALRVLQLRMRKAMRARVRLASERTGQFPDGRLGWLLQAAPSEMARLILGERA